MDWFYAQNGEQLGPVSEARLGELSRSGAVLPDTLVWHSGMSEWQPFRSVSTGVAEPQRSCSSCGNQFSAADLAVFGESAVCAACKPDYVQRLRQGMATTNPQAFRYAGFWIRALAYFIDLIILEILYYAIILPLGFPLVNTAQDVVTGAWLIPLSISLATNFLYFPFFTVRYGATPGKMALGLKIVRPDGGPISVGQAIGRYAAQVVSGLIVGIGYMMAGWDSEKRALHDRMAETRVIRTR